jgi:CheY-like chemotaxis protein
MSRVLVVDDDRPIREMLRFALESEGYDVLTLSDGTRVVETLAALTEPCVVLMDLMMPHMDGWAVCAMLERADPLLARHPLVVMSAGLLDGDSYPAPARVLLRKPFDLNHLLRLIASLTLATAAGACAAAPLPAPTSTCDLTQVLAS